VHWHRLLTHSTERVLPVADLSTLLDIADLAVARSEGVLSDSDRADLATTAARLRSRGGYVGDVVVVALAGGTGSGKSSLLNALVSEAVAPVGVIRPTTTRSTAVVPAEAEADFTALVSALNVDSVVRSDALTSTVLVDLPDFDSVEMAHRHIVGRVLPAVDAVLWVFDPEKYADRIVHDEFLTRLTPYENQFIFILNQIDRLGTSAGSVQLDLESKLSQDGYRDPEVVQCVASGDLQLDEVVTSIADRFNTKTTALAKAALDLRLSANTAWKQATERPQEVPDIDPGARALALATFTWLGIDAYDYWYSIERGRDARHRE
jgi:GTP-binding protein EngB required for normal cell division